MQKSDANKKLSDAGCSFKTIPKSLKQHPFSVMIIHSAITYRITRETLQYRIYFKAVNGE